MSEIIIDSTISTKTGVQDIDPYQIGFSLKKFTEENDNSTNLPEVLKNQLPILLKAYDTEFTLAEQENFNGKHDNTCAMYGRCLYTLIDSNHLYSNEPADPSKNFIEKLAKDEEFSEKALLSRYLSQEISNYYYVKSTSDSFDSDHKFKNKVDSIIFPALLQNIQLLSKENNHQAIMNSLERISTSNEKEYLNQLIDLKDFGLTIDLINIYGLMPVLNIIGKKGQNDEVFKEFYSKLQGDVVQKIFTTTQEVYDQINFENYNSSETTSKELSLIKNEIQESSFDKNANILDLGAGTGRHAIPLSQEGYNITALELQKKHVEYIQKQNHNIEIIQDSWHKLDELTDDEFNFIYCLNRSALHNQTPVEMLSFFDNISAVLSQNGTLMIDFPDTTKGEYFSRIENYKQHLLSLGVKEDKLQHLFDGTDNVHRLNRLALSKEQIVAFASLVGLKFEKMIPQESTGNIYNDTYIFKKDYDFDPEDKVYPLGDWVRSSGILTNYDPDAINYFIKNIRVSVGQILMYGDNNISRPLHNNENLGGKKPYICIDKSTGNSYTFSEIVHPPIPSRF